MKIVNALRHAVAGKALQNAIARTKRMILIASLFVKIKDDVIISDDLISKLNKAMALSSTDTALRLPMQMSNVIWRWSSREICSVNLMKPHLTEAEVKTAISSVKDHTPKWLRYDKDVEFERDITKLLVTNRDIVLS